MASLTLTDTGLSEWKVSMKHLDLKGYSSASYPKFSNQDLTTF